MCAHIQTLCRDLGCQYRIENKKDKWLSDLKTSAGQLVVLQVRQLVSVSFFSFSFFFWPWLFSSSWCLTPPYGFHLQPPFMSHPADLTVIPGGDGQEKIDTRRGQRGTDAVIKPWRARRLQIRWIAPSEGTARIWGGDITEATRTNLAMSRRRSTGDLVPRDITEILAREARAQRGQKKTGISLGQAFSWLRKSRRKKNLGNGLNRIPTGVKDNKLGQHNEDAAKG